MEMCFTVTHHQDMWVMVKLHMEYGHRTMGIHWEYFWYVCNCIYYIWLVASTPLKKSQLGWLFPRYGKITNVWNHQPDICWVNDHISLTRIVRPWLGMIPGFGRDGSQRDHHGTSHHFFVTWTTHTVKYINMLTTSLMLWKFIIFHQSNLSFQPWKIRSNQRKVLSHLSNHI